ncbi:MULTISPECIES: hypothetical protein [Streptomyces]|uniref:Integral membrane protein n=1 Tax=Streptomyces ramulosus TaxID=47762 RepID=A0ABW1FBM3_9ACTN
MFSLCADHISSANRVIDGLDFIQYLRRVVTGATLLLLFQVAIVIAVLVLSFVLTPLLGGRLNRWVRQIFEPSSSRRQERAAEFAEQYVRNAMAHMESAASGISDDVRNRLVRDAKVWHAHSRLWTARQAALLALAVWLLVNIHHIGDFISSWVSGKCDKSPPGGSGGDAKGCPLGRADQLGWPWDLKVNFVREKWGYVKKAVRPLEYPVHTATTVAAALLVVIVITVAYPLTSIVWRNWRRRPSRNPPVPDGARAAAGPGPAGEVNRCWPTVRLLNICTEVSRASRQLETDGAAPLVSLRNAESVVYSAWRTRHRRKRFSRSQEFSDHAELVVGALRAAESRQERESDTKNVLEDTHAMLLKIGDRYTAGRTLALLDPEDLEGVEPVVRRGWIKAAFALIIMAGFAAGATALEAPEEVWTPLIAAIPVLAWGIAYMRPARIVETLALWNGSGRHRAE